MAKKQVNPEIEEIKKGLETKTVLIGTDEAVKELKRGTVEKVFITNNAPDMVKDDLGHYADIAGVEVVELSISNEDLGVLCKKPFQISVLSFKKDEQN